MPTLSDRLRNLARNARAVGPVARPVSEQPLRAELFTAEQLARHARELAEFHQVGHLRSANTLLAQLDENEETLRAFNRSTQGVNPNRRITPAAEWLLDNFYLIEEQIQMARRHLPRGYNKELPQLTTGPNAGLPRVYDLMIELIAHVDAQIDAGQLDGFVAAYQSGHLLRLGELWAIPIMLRLGLIENLHRVAAQLAVARAHRDLADHWVDQLQEMAERHPSRLVVVVAEMAQAELPISSSFVATFCQRLSRHSPVLHLARHWLEERLHEHGLTIEQLVHQESQLQAADQVSVSHSIASLRLLGSTDWKQFVEALSQVEATLQGDPAAVYPRMDFATRDSYRHAVEFIARHSGRSELEVAQEAVALAEAAAQGKGADDRTAHVGYYLIDRGLPILEERMQVRAPWHTLVERAVRRYPLVFYAGGILVFTLLATLGFVLLARAVGVTGIPLLVSTGLVLLCASQLGVALLNLLSSLLVTPKLLPRLDYSAGVPEADRTMVVVPTLLTSPAGVDRLLETLEIHHLANRDPFLNFALLTDFRDAPTEVAPNDAALLQRARAGIEALNAKCAAEGREPFHLLHRPRRWNAGEGLWMGYERKRGKLAEFNALLRGGARECFSEMVGDAAVLPQIRYVITLDTDTQLPREAARKLVGTMAHRLNRPEFDPERGIVAEGYSILQPRVGVSLPSSRRSWFVRLFGGDAGIDPYTRAVSDVYQDVFREGSFIGKGIYEVDAFERALTGRIPENTVLSHDLLESVHARSALVSDVEFYEEYPSRYNVDVDRRHRWIRGDWQATQWLLPRVPGPDARQIANPLSALSRFKLFDNLRRSLVPVALLLFLLGSWLFLPQLGALGSLLVGLLICLPGLLSTVCGLFAKPTDLPWSMHLRSVADSAGRQLGQVFLTLTFLPYDAFISFDAISRTLLRVLVTRKRLLEWQTSSDAERLPRADLPSFYRTMWVPPALAAVVGGLLVLLQPTQILHALPVLALWLVAPWIAWRISQPIDSTSLDLDAEQVAFLRRTARKTWSFFETFVTAEENWLPPDNFQEVPLPKVATRTSPTNMGLALLANLAAVDFGYLSRGGLIRRTQHAFAAMLRLERHRGHFFNWYDTRTLEPLLPRYVSSVDSGNLCGHLLTLSAGLREQRTARLLPKQVWPGLLDTLRLLRELLPHDPLLLGLEASLLSPPAEPRAACELLLQVEQAAGAVPSDSGDTVPLAAGQLQRQCADHLDELRTLAPWLAAPRLDPAGLPTEWREAIQSLEAATTASDLLALSTVVAGLPHTPARRELEDLRLSVQAAAETIQARRRTLEDLARQSDELAMVDFTFLFDPAKDLFSIGYNVSDSRADTSSYDLLASEARLCSYLAIAFGQVPQDHWFSLGRLLVGGHGDPILVSWSGSMFEYLMPLLVMPNYDGTLLDHSCRAAVQCQIDYGGLQGVPWGISESGYHRTDALLNYQYRAFGVPGLGLQRGLADDLVIAPYATAMALMVTPRAACDNLERLAREGREGSYGFYEAVDYTRSRLPPEDSSALIRSYMAHHQGMSLLALDNVLQGFPMHRRFLACPLLKAADLLLQERVPRTAANVFVEDLALETARPQAVEGEETLRVFTQPNSPAPELQLLSNGRYHVVITSAGGGYSRWRDLALTRWREDATRDCWGTFIYLRDAATGQFWSTAFQPTLRSVQGYEAIFTQGRSEFRQREGGLEIHTEICVSPEDDVEIRRVKITNRGDQAREIELTSYAEVVLARAESDAAHPAFSNLFVQTEFVRESSALFCTRRPRSAGEAPPWLLHLLVEQNGRAGELSCETDRTRFVGRGGTLAVPAALIGAVAPLSNTVGSVLDPIVSLRRQVRIPEGETVVFDLVLGVAEDRAGVQQQADKYQSARMTERAFDLGWTHSQVALRQLNASQGDGQLYDRLAGALIFADPARRATAAVLRGNRRGQSGLWGYGISGDAPIVLLRVSDAEKIEIVRQLVQAHSYWRMKGLAVELVILNEDASVYRQSLHDRIVGLISSGLEAQMLDKPGGIFIRQIDQIPHEDRTLLQAVARLFLDDERGSLAEQFERRNVLEVQMPLLVASRSAATEPPPALPARDLLFENGLGGFTRDGREYVITLAAGQSTPAPWVNVLANPNFGTVVSESGGAYTWAENAHEYRLSPWTNDPVQDTPGEALYLRDEQTGQFWSPTPLPTRGETPYVIRHGFGYTVFEHTEHGIASELWVYVAMDASVKFSALKLRNVSGRPRRISATGYWEWVLGELRSKSLLHVQTEIDLKSGALLARNHFNTEFADRIAFLDVDEIGRTVTGDRKEFLGRNGTLARPAALLRARLSGKVGVGLDPCGALQVAFDLAPGQKRETCFRLGVGRSLSEVQNLIQRFRRAGAGSEALAGVHAHWNRTLGAVHVETPDPAVNLLANGWLLYQTISCRLWGRTGFYQSGGAYGFRDQLQDVMALMHAEPALAREQILRAAARQFREGDVQHWWHPPLGRGVRTHFSDDYLWLPYVACRYVQWVGDTGVLDEPVAFLEGRLLKPEEESYYDLPQRADESATLYEHCVRAIERSLKFGAHGLPLIGCGDWNDGLNMVGKDGRGESVWLALFLYDVLQRFSQLAQGRQDATFAARCLSEAARLRENIEAHAWDGEWYLRAFFDDGQPLGSSTSLECQIDSLPQSWSVLSGAGEPERSRKAMRSVDRRLVRREDKLIQLFDPPFDRSAQDPGYLKGYIPGVRENGGQYTHGAIWTAMAMAEMGEIEKAWELCALLNPIHHGSTAAQIATYKVEPYVIAADVYGVAPHIGRGGWTWYTGSAGWMYRLLLETLLGLHLEGEQLRLSPRPPRSWPGFTLKYRYRETNYDIAIRRLPAAAEAERELRLDHTLLSGETIPLRDDRRPHVVELKMRWPE